MRRRVRPASAPLGLVPVAALLAGCSARALVPSPDDPLRARIHQLEEESRLLKQENDELRQSIARAATNTDALRPEILANAPIPTRIVGAFGSAVPAAGGSASTPATDGPIELTVQVSPTDSRDRFVQLTGWVDVSVVTFTKNPAEAVVLATKHFEPGEVRDSLRAGLFGIHYAFTVPLPAGVARDHRLVVARVLYRDGFTQRELETIAECPLRR